MNRLKAHPIAECYPEMPADEYEALRADVKKYGVLTPIWLYEGMILDGRHRYRAAMEVGRKCPTQEYTGDDPVAFVKSCNDHRRHLPTSQRAMVAAKLANIKFGDNQHVSKEGASAEAPSTPRKNTEKNGGSGPKVSQEDAARMLNVSRASVQRAKAINESGRPEIIKAVERGDMSLKAAERAIKAKPEPKPEPASNGKHEPPTQAQKLAAAKEEAAEMRQLAHEVSRIRKRLLEIADSAIGTFLHKQYVQAHGGNLLNTINAALPYAECGYCDGQEKRCKACHGLGWVTRDLHKYTPAELKR